jgi:apolipoprotein N-acyltransferase
MKKTMLNNLTPKNVFKGTNADGSKFTAREYDFETYATLELGSVFTLLFGGAILGVFLAPLLFVLSVLSFDGYSKIKFWVTAIISAYVLFDFSHGWLMLRLLDFIFEESSLNILLAINTGVLICSVGFILIGGLLYRWIIDTNESLSTRWVVYIVAVSIIFFIGYSMGKGNAKKNIGWVEQKLELPKSQSEKDYEKYENMNSQEIEQDAETRYQEQLRKEGRNPEDVERYAN